MAGQEATFVKWENLHLRTTEDKVTACCQHFGQMGWELAAALPCLIPQEPVVNMNRGRIEVVAMSEEQQPLVGMLLMFKRPIRDGYPAAPEPARNGILPGR